MPDCTTEQAAYNLALATQAVRYAEYLVASAEMSLAMSAWSTASNDASAKYWTLMACQSGYGGMMGMRSAAGDPATLIVAEIADLQAAHVVKAKNLLDKARKHLSDLQAKASK